MIRRGHPAKRWGWVIAFMAISSRAWAQSAGAVPIPDDPNVRLLAQLANTPDGRVDYAKVQTAVERAINPAFDAAAFHAELDRWASLVRTRFTKSAILRRET